MVAQWQLPYLGLKSLPEELSAWELDYFFTLSADELHTVQQRYQGLHRLGAALQLGFLRMTGCTLDAMRLVPPSLLHHLAKQLHIGSPTIASLRALYHRQRTRYEHQSWAMQWLGFSAINERQRRVLGTRLRHEARTVADTGALIQFARRWLYDHRLVILAARSLKELTASILAQVERSQYLEVLNVVPESVCQAWPKQLYTWHPHYQVQLIDWLKTRYCQVDGLRTQLSQDEGVGELLRRFLDRRHL